MRKVIFIILFLPIFMWGQNTVTICNGDSVFLYNNWEAAWDGKINNEYATKGVYTYSIILTDLNEKLRTYEGAITLIR